MRAPTLVMLVIAGCGSGDVDTLCDEGDGVVTRFWNASEECRTEALANPLFTTAYHAQNCRSYFQPLFDSQAIEIDGAAVSRCREAIATNTCTPALYKDWWHAVSVCNEVTDGTRHTAVSCSVDDECAGDSFCEAPAGTCGTCAPQRGTGMPCQAGRECQSGLCGANQCVSAASAAAGNACAIDGQCGRGLICRKGACAPLDASIGQACTTDSECGVYQASCANQVCVALAGEGQACTIWGQVATTPRCKWFDGQGCIGGQCTAMPIVGEGAACGFDVARCSGELTCANLKCIKIVPEGGACDRDEVCGPYAICRDRACSFSDLNDACTPSISG